MYGHTSNELQQLYSPKLVMLEQQQSRTDLKTETSTTWKNIVNYY